jgi:hypothetical protein
MKVLLLTLTMVVCFSSYGHAQATGEKMKNLTPEERAQKMTDWMKTNLQLTDDQTPSIHAINLKYATQNEALKGDTGARRDKYKRFKETQEAKDQELKGAMTPEQFSTYLSKKKELQDKMKEEVRERKN